MFFDIFLSLVGNCTFSNVFHECTSRYWYLHSKQNITNSSFYFPSTYLNCPLLHKFTAIKLVNYLSDKRVCRRQNNRFHGNVPHRNPAWVLTLLRNRPEPYLSHRILVFHSPLSAPSPYMSGKVLQKAGTEKWHF